MPPEKRHLPLFLLSFLLSPTLTAAVSFDFSSLTLGSLKLLGDAHLKNGSIRLSRDLPVPNSGAGRALFSDPVRLRHPSTGAVLPFSTFFSFSVINLNPSSIGGGLAFLFAQDDASLGDPGAFLGLLSSSSSSFFAVEFDTLMDPQFGDINGNHVGVDLNSITSALVADLDSAGIDLKSGRTINAWIRYDDRPGLLLVFLSYSADQPLKPVLTFPLNLAQRVGEFMFVGFSASTQGSTEIHSIESWSFSSSSSTAEPISPSAAASPSSGNLKSPSRSSSRPAAGSFIVAAAGAFVIAAAAALGIICFMKRRRTNPAAFAAAVIVKTPREFSYRELISATERFNPGRIIGHGAFGTVYKGVVPETGATIAVKRCINARARSEFLSELSIIASLRHRNLVRLQGYCQERGEILLVYDYMRHGSLDRALFNPSASAAVLSWNHRRKILAGVASALAYLHHDCELQVIHRDVKSSNVMLGEDFHPRLGDFGLASQIDRDRSPVAAAAAAGTMGYLAPEYLLTGRASDKTDVYSFGALVLEVVSGRRPIDGRRSGSLVEWVWGLHGEGRLVEAADPRLGMEDLDFVREAMRRLLLVGLGCSSPDPAMRPGMRNVVQMIGDEAAPPDVPAIKPDVRLVSNRDLLLSLRDSVSDYDAIAELTLSSSSSSSCLRSGDGGG